MIELDDVPIKPIAISVISKNASPDVPRWQKADLRVRHQCLETIANEPADILVQRFRLEMHVFSAIEPLRWLLLKNRPVLRMFRREFQPTPLVRAIVDWRWQYSTNHWPERQIVGAV